MFMSKSGSEMADIRVDAVNMCRKLKQSILKEVMRISQQINMNKG